MALTQQQIADHLDLSQTEVSKLLKQLDIDWKESDLDTIRVAYIQKLRAQASGHRTDDGLDLVRERVMSERVDRELKMFTLAEKKGQLINVAELEPAMTQMVGAWRTELMARDDALKADLDTLYGIDIDIQVINDYTFAAFNHLAQYDASRRGDAAPDSGDGGPAGTDIADELGAPAP